MIERFLDQNRITKKRPDVKSVVVISWPSDVQECANRFERSSGCEEINGGGTVLSGDRWRRAVSKKKRKKLFCLLVKRCNSFCSDGQRALISNFTKYPHIVLATKVYVSTFPERLTYEREVVGFYAL